MKEKLYVFGFDNTLVNTEDLIVDMTNKVLGIDMSYDFWYANLSVTTPDVECTMWQYSHTGRVPGIPEIVDRDHSFIDYKSRMIELGLNGY